MDYMSDEYLKVEEKERGRGKRRKQQSLLQPMNKKQILEHMNTRRVEGLDTKLDETNKGFKLLQKMGYTEGSGLGKNETGCDAPIRVDVRDKADRSGIGMIAESNRIAEKIQARLQQYRMEDLQAGFQASLRRKQQCRQLTADIRISEKAIMELDEKHGVDRHSLWPEDKSVVLQDDSVSILNSCEASHSIDEFESSLLRLECLITYLRKTYFYCVHCGFCYNDVDDMCSNCPGPLRDDHSNM